MAGGNRGQAPGRAVSAPPAVHVCDDTFVRASPTHLAASLGRQGELRRRLPRLRLRVLQDRGVHGVRWSARSRGPVLPWLGPRWVGDAEVWLEPWHDGTVVHLFVRLDRATGGGSGRRLSPRRVRSAERRARRLQDTISRTWKREVHRWKDRMEQAT